MRLRPDRRTRNQFTLLRDFQDRLVSGVSRLVQFLAASASESGSTVSTTGFSFPASTSFAISHNCAELGVPRQESRAHTMFGSFLGRRRSNNRDQNPALFQHLPRAVLGIASQRVEHHVHIVDNILETSLFVIDLFVNSQSAQKRLIPPRRCPDHMGSLPSCEL